MNFNKIVKNIVGIISLIIFIVMTYMIVNINILPNKYLFMVIGIELLYLIICFILINLKRGKVLKIIGIILLCLLMIGNSVVIYYVHNTNRHINNGFTKTYTETTKYYLLANVNDSNNDISKFTKNTEIKYYKYSRSIDKALKLLGNYKYIDTDNISDALCNISNNNGYLLISEANYKYLIDSSNLFDENNYKIIKDFNVVENKKRNNEVKDVYNVYIAGLDFTGIMRDFNMIATVNTKTHKVVLTSIPRDYYIDVPTYGMKDTLMALGSLDSEVSKEALENLFDIKIDYTVNINTNSLVKVVDKLNGIEFCSDYEFTTNHALVESTYDDSKGDKLFVPKGCKHYSGIEILAIARERMAFPGRDRVRQQNCRKIAIEIAKSLISTSTLTNYNDVLNSFDGLYVTDMNKKTITNLFKSVLNGDNYEIIEQSVDGSDIIGIGHLGTADTWTMTPAMDTVNQASNKIKEVMKDK